MAEAEEASLRIRGLKALAIRVALPFMVTGNFLFRLHKDEQIKAIRKRLS